MASGVAVVGTGVRVLENMFKRAYDVAVEKLVAKLSTYLDTIDGSPGGLGGETVAEQTTTKKTLLALIAGMEGLKGSLIKEV